MNISYTREQCILLLREKQQQLAQQGLARLPQRADFSEEQVVACKAFWGPWPRVLEAAGCKPARNDDRLQRNREKRIRAKRRRRETEKEIKNARGRST